MRWYGYDITERLESAGFEVQVLRPTDLDTHTRQRMQLEGCGGADVLLCRKPG